MWFESFDSGKLQELFSKRCWGGGVKKRFEILFYFLGFFGKMIKAYFNFKWDKREILSKFIQFLSIYDHFPKRKCTWVSTINYQDIFYSFFFVRSKDIFYFN